MERDHLERTIVMKVTKKPHAEANAPRLEPVKSTPARSPEETQKALNALASLYRMFRG